MLMTYLFSHNLQDTNMPYPLFHPDRRAQLPTALDSTAFAAEFPGEGEHIEFKQGLSPARVQEAATAFSNTDGGVYLVGVSDAGLVVGIRSPGERAKYLHQAVRDVQNPGRHEVHHLQVEGKDLVMLSVARRQEGFAQTSAGAVLVRRGASNTPLLGADLSRFLARRAFAAFELTPTTIRFDGADAALRRRLCEAYGWADDEVLVDRMVEAGFVTHERSETLLTVAGALVLAPEPHVIGGRAYVDIRRFADGESDPDKAWAIHGPVDHQIEQAVTVIEDELGSVSAIVGTRRVELPRLPHRALREAIANAVAHRSYENAGTAIRIELRPTHVAITSPGGPPEPVTIAHIRSQQAARNDRLLGALRRFNLAEDKGLGIDRIEDDMAAELLHAPEFSTDGSFFTVALRLDGVVTPRERAWVRGLVADARLDPRSALVVVTVARQGSVTNSHVRELLGIDSTEARSILQALTREGVLVMSGNRGGAEYHIAAGVGVPARIRHTDAELDEIAVAQAERGRLTNTTLRAETGLAANAARKVLRRLVDRRVIAQNGSKRGTHYVLLDDS